jgi:hypothetical protein
MKANTLKGGAREFVLTEQEFENLRSCLSVCVWIRSEQLAHPDSVLSVPVDTHDLHTAYCQQQRDGGIALYRRMTELLGPVHVPPSWVQRDGNSPR